MRSGSVASMSLHTLLTFSAATLVLLLIPGPAVMYIVTRSAAQGGRAGLVSVAGIHLGTVVHVVAAMVGLSALVAASATAFTVVKLVGAGYLIWLGIGSIRAYRRGSTALRGPAVERRHLSRVFVDGFVLNVFNPKTAIFFLSFVPQFVDPGAPSPALVIGTLGAVFIALGLVTDSGYALAGGWIGGRLRRSDRLRRRQELIAGGTYIGLGAIAALGGHRAAA